MVDKAMMAVLIFISPADTAATSRLNLLVGTLGKAVGFCRVCSFFFVATKTVLMKQLRFSCARSEW